MKISEELLKSEPRVKAEDIARELTPLIEDYFIGEAKLDGKVVIYSMPNGQTFYISVKEAV